MTKYSSSFNGCLPTSDVGAKMILAADTDLSWTVPGAATVMYRAKFSMSDSADVWVAVGKAAVLPTAGTLTATYKEELRPDVWFVTGGTILHFRATGTPEVGVSLLEIPQ